MLSRFGPGAMFVCIAYCLPFAGTSLPVADLRWWGAIVAALVLLVTQPPLSAAQAREDSATDRSSAPLILVGALITQVAAAMEYRLAPTPLPSVAMAGAAGMVIAGTAVRLWSIRVLGRFFTATVHVDAGQQLVLSGPYRWLRHPSYLGAYVAIVGIPLLLSAPRAAGLAAALMALIYARRVSLEEEALLARFGAEYVGYQRRTWALFPLVW